VPFALVFTKADKISQREVGLHVKLFLAKMRETWEYLPPHFITSAEKRLGARQLLTFIHTLNEAYFLHKG
jgi:GTP-binding protein